MSCIKKTSETFGIIILIQSQQPSPTLPPPPEQTAPCLPLPPPEQRALCLPPPPPEQTAPHLPPPSPEQTAFQRRTIPSPYRLPSLTVYSPTSHLSPARVLSSRPPAARSLFSSGYERSLRTTRHISSLL